MTVQSTVTGAANTPYSTYRPSFRSRPRPLNVHFTRAVRSYLASDDAVTDPRRYLVPAREAVAEAVTAMIAAVN